MIGTLKIIKERKKNIQITEREEDKKTERRKERKTERKMDKW